MRTCVIIHAKTSDFTVKCKVSVSMKVIPLRTDPVYPSCEEVLAICCAFVLWSSVWGEQQPDGVGMVDEGVVTELHYSGILLQAHSI